MTYQAVIGLLFFVFLAWLVSENRAQVSIKTIISGIVIQLILACIRANPLQFKGFSDG